MFKNRKRKNGFTLVELLVVIAIIGILAAVVAPNAFKAIEKSKVSAAESDYRAIKTAALTYYSDTGAWPVDTADSVGFVTLPTTGTGAKQVTSTVNSSWNGPYIERWPSKNPWGGSYVYHILASPPTGVGLSSTTKYIQLDNVNNEAIKKLEADLDGGSDTTSSSTGVVRFAASGTTCYLVISDQ